MKTKLFLATSAVMAAALAMPFGHEAKGSEFLAVQAVSGSANSTLTVRITGLVDIEGQVLIGLYDSAMAYDEDQDLEGRTVDVTSATVSATFENLPVGYYALKVFHDANSNGQLDTDFGFPSEAYGFSNNASDPFSAPEWEETKFSLPMGRMTQTIDLD